MKTLETRKFDIISQISEMKNENLVYDIENYINNLIFQLNNSDIFAKQRKNLKIEDLIKEQNYKGVNKEKFEKLVSELDINEPISELLKLI